MNFLPEKEQNKWGKKTQSEPVVLHTLLGKERAVVCLRGLLVATLLSTLVLFLQLDTNLVNRPYSDA